MGVGFSNLRDTVRPNRRVPPIVRCGTLPFGDGRVLGRVGRRVRRGDSGLLHFHLALAARSTGKVAAPAQIFFRFGSMTWGDAYPCFPQILRPDVNRDSD